MKKALWIVLVVLVLSAAVVFAACEAQIDDGNIDVDEETLAKIPATVDVKGLEGVTGTAKVNYVDATTEAAAMTAIKATDYYIPEGATTYAVDIQIVDADGKAIEVGKPVTVSIELKTALLPLDQYVVFHIHDGEATLIEPTVDGNKLTFTVSTFSPFIVVPKHIHTYGEWATQSEATCQSKKVEERVCACGAKETRQVGELGAHNYGAWKEDIAAGCESAGSKSHICSVCGDVEEEAIDALGHIDLNEDEICDRCGNSLHVHAYDDWHVYSDPDCLNVGIEIRECACGAKETREFGAALGHVDLNEDEICDRCGTSLHVHAYGAWTVYSPATCTEAAVERRQCACGASETRTVGEALGHDTQYFAPVSESCTEDGNIEYFYCSRCEKYFLEAECNTEITLDSTVIKAPGHVDSNGDKVCDACHASLIETPYDYVAGKVFKFDHAEGEGVNNATYAEAYADATLTFFKDNYMEYHVFNGVRGGNVAAANMVLCGTYTMQAVDGGYEIAMSVTKRYYDDEETMIPIAKYIFNYNEAAATVSVADYPATLYYKADAEATPTQYVAPALADNWNDAVIIAAFNAVGATKDYTFPKLDNVLTMTKGEVQENGLVTVTIVMSSKMQGTQAATQYKDYLEFIYYDYSWTNVYGNPETRVNTDDNQFWFVMSVGNIDVYAALTVTIGRFYPAYPDAGIVNYLTDAGITDSIPEFKTPWAMKYHFDTEGYSPAIACIWAELRYEDGVEQHDTDVAEEFVTMLKSEQYGYTEKEINDVTYLCSPNNQMLLRVRTGKVGNSVSVYIYDYSIIYPAEAIAAYLEGTSDPFIDLDDDSVFGYALYTNEADNPTALRLVGKFPSSVNAHLFVSGLMSAYTEAGYKWGGYATHFGNEEDETNYYHAWISPNQEIAIMFSSFNNGEHLFGNFSYYSVSIINLTKIDAANKAFMTSLSAAGHSTTVERGAKYTFNGGIAYLYTNAQTGLVGGGAYTTDLFLVDVGTLDTSTPGERTFRISLKRNADIYVDVPITVLGLTGISATANTQVIDDRYVYTSTLYTQASYYTITRYYSDGHTDTVKGTDSSIAFGDIDGSKAQQDLTISCTVDGVTVSTTVAIGLFKSFNYTCTNDWDITNDDATFAALVKGGTYGDIGCWITVNCNFNPREKTIIGMVYVDATSIRFARVSPDLYDELFGSLFIDPETEGIWNKSDVITLQDGPSNGNFAFLG